MKYYKYIVIFLSILVLLLAGYIIYMRSTISLLDEDDDGNNTISNVNDKELNYDCSFTKTYRFIQKIDYETYVEGTTYIVGDIYQSYEPVLLVINNDTLSKLEKNKYYEFTYTLKGKMRESEVDDMNEINMLVKNSYDIEDTSNRKISLVVKETDKVGLNQIQEPICKGK